METHGLEYNNFIVWKKLLGCTGGGISEMKAAIKMTGMRAKWEIMKNWTTGILLQWPVYLPVVGGGFEAGSSWD